MDTIDFTENKNAQAEACEKEVDFYNKVQLITNKLRDTLAQKNHDYGDSFHRQFARHGMVASDFHISEKYDRFISLIGKDARVPGESIKDTLLDMAGYCIPTLIEIRDLEMQQCDI